MSVTHCGYHERSLWFSGADSALGRSSPGGQGGVVIERPTIKETAAMFGEMWNGRMPAGVRAAAVSAVLAAALLMSVAAGIASAADFQEAKGNVCEGNLLIPKTEEHWCEWARHLTTGIENTAIGANMMPKLTSGSDNVAVGAGALEHTTTAASNIAIGVQALKEDTEGTGNLAAGQGALVLNTKGSDNVALGPEAMMRNSSGTNDIAIGRAAISQSTGGGPTASIALGALALNEAGGTEDIGIGDGAIAHGAGSLDVGLGVGAMEGEVGGGSENVAIGDGALDGPTSGGGDVAIGYKAGTKFENGGEDIDIANAGESVFNEDNTTRIGTEGEQTRAFIAGIYNTTIKGAKPCKVSINEEGQLGCKVEKTKKEKAASIDDTEVSTLQAQVARQQQEINQLAGEIKELRK